mgnify:CR=1 FL=1
MFRFEDPLFLLLLLLLLFLLLFLAMTAIGFYAGSREVADEGA